MIFCRKDNDFKVFLYHLKKLGKAMFGEGAIYKNSIEWPCSDHWNKLRTSVEQVPEVPEN